ncbi:MAG: beta-lactamase family protein [bacterium]|nr:beta-lactamase family protein [bacterium]
MSRALHRRTSISSAIAIAACALFSTGSACTSSYAGRYIFWNYPTVEDHLIFPTRAIAPAPSPVSLEVRPTAIASLIGAQTTLWSAKATDGASDDRAAPEQRLRADNFAEFLADNETRSLLIARDGRLVYENYFNNADRDTLMAGFSVSKSVVGLLAGIALADGSLQSIDDPLAQYVPELESAPVGGIPLRDLLNMTSGIRFERASWPWADAPRSYHSSDLRGLVADAEIAAPPGTAWLYSEFNPPLTAWAIERATGQTIAEFLESRVWRKAMAGEARWLVDDADRRVELAHAGFYATARDLLRLGLLVQYDGRIAGRRILAAGLVRKITTLAGDDPEIIRGVPASFAPGGYAYKNGWWLPLDPETKQPTGDCIAAGLYGQFVFISPARRLIIVRTGSDTGAPGIAGWFSLLERLARAVHAES